MRHTTTFATVGVLLGIFVGTARAQMAVTDPATTLKNAVTAALKEQLAKVQEDQLSQIKRMAHRLSLFTDLAKYAVADAPRWRIHDFEDGGAFLFSRGYNAALNYGDGLGVEFLRIARTRKGDLDSIRGLPPEMREAIVRMLATLDAADGTAIAGTHQTGVLRFNGRREQAAIDALERHVIDPSQEQSATAVADKISGAVLIGARQRQTRLQLLTAIAEQLLVDSKRARDTEAASMNMQLKRLQEAGRLNKGLIAGTADDLRTWRQP